MKITVRKFQREFCKLRNKSATVVNQDGEIVGEWIAGCVSDAPKEIKEKEKVKPKQTAKESMSDTCCVDCGSKSIWALGKCYRCLKANKYE